MTRSTKSKSANIKTQKASSSRKSIPEKCRKCAMLSATQAQDLHGEDGDGCWIPAVCYSRRSYARHRDRRNQTRRQKHQKATLEQLAVDVPEFADLFTAILIVYRQPGAETPVHAVGAEIWKGQEQHALVQPIHCIGMVPSQVIAYVRKMSALLDASYGIKKFASEERLDPSLCPLRPCPHHPELQQ